MRLLKALDPDGWRRHAPIAGHGLPGRRGPPPTTHAKELRLLEHVLSSATAGDASSVCEAIERFGEEVLGTSTSWLKVAGGAKAKVLTEAVRGTPPGGEVLEIGAYCGYSAIRMAMVLPSTRIHTLEVDPVHVIIARNVIAYAGLAHLIDVWTGHSQDLLPRLARRAGAAAPGFRAVFMDQRGSRYEDDLELLERHGLLRPGAAVVADNVLKPGAPVFLWRLREDDAYHTEIVSVREFAMPAEDWMSVSTLLRPPAPSERPRAGPPAELLELRAESDRLRRRATSPGGVSFADWAAFAERAGRELARWGLAPARAA